MRAEWQATWEAGACAGATLIVDVQMDIDTVDSLRIVGFLRDSVVCEEEKDRDAAVAFCEGLIGQDWSEVGALESEDGDELAWELEHAEQAAILAQYIDDRAREQRQIANTGTK